VGTGFRKKIMPEQKDMSLVANARMYAVTPAVAAAWRALFDWVARESGVSLGTIDHAAPAPLEALWARDDLGAAFMCGFPFALSARKPSLLAALVPSPARYGERPQYCTDLIVRADSGFERLRDTFGGRIGWTVGHSQSGYNAVRHHLLGRPEARYQWVGPLVTPRRVIEAALAGEIDVGPLDSYVHDLLRRHDPETASRLRVLESTAMTPIPPLIAAPAVDAATVSRLRQALLSCSAAPGMRATLEELLLARFEPIDAAAYDVLSKWAGEADAGGVPAPADS
jgi:ABC-type phosphate/phosphonate transport system substrate-binding protein